MNFQSFSQVAFAFAVTPSLLGAGAGLRRVDGACRRPAARHPRARDQPVVTACGNSNFSVGDP